MVREPLDRVVTAGATDVGNVSFSDISKVLDQAGVAVIADARCKAKIYAKAAGVQLGWAEWIMEDTSNGSSVLMLAPAQAPPLPIASGEDKLRAKVPVGFAIARVSRSGDRSRVKSRERFVASAKTFATAELIFANPASEQPASNTLAIID